MKDVSMAAAALYDGGWRAEDQEELAVEYQLSKFEASEICKYLARYECQSVNQCKESDL